MKQNKKGFTIIELVIVISVVAILAGVLIPVFSNIVKKANVSADQQAVRQMNTVLSIAAVNEDIETIDDVYAILEEAGFTAKTYNALTANTRFVWMVEECSIAHVNEENKITYPAELVGKEVTQQNSINLVKDKPIDPNNLGYADAPVATAPPYNESYNLKGVTKDVLSINLWTFMPEDDNRELDPITEKKKLDERNKYLAWIADFYIQANDDFEADSVGIYGAYWGLEENFTSADNLEKGFNFLLMKDIYGELGISITYEYLLSVCEPDANGERDGFTCGVYNLSEDNFGKSITVELRLYEPIKDANGNYTSERSDKYVVCNKVDYPFENPNA